MHLSCIIILALLSSPCLVTATAGEQHNLNIYDYQKVKLRELMVEEAMREAKFLERLHPEQELIMHMPQEILDRDYTVVSEPNGGSDFDKSESEKEEGDDMPAELDDGQPDLTGQPEYDDEADYIAYNEGIGDLY